MKKIIFICLALSMTGCMQSNNASTQSINTKISDSTNSTELKFSFKIKDAASLSHVKSVDAYLVTDKTNPLGTIAAGTGLKQVDVDSTGTISFTFIVSSAGGTYYAALQAYDNKIASGSRHNITALNSVVTTGTGDGKRFSFSTNTATYNGSLTYSSGTALNVAIDLEFNNLPVNITPAAGSPLPVNSISVG